MLLSILIQNIWRFGIFVRIYIFVVNYFPFISNLTTLAEQHFLDNSEKFRFFLNNSHYVIVCDYKFKKKSDLDVCIPQR